MLLISFSYQIALARITSTILDKSDESGNPGLVPHLRDRVNKGNGRGSDCGPKMKLASLIVLGRITGIFILFVTLYFYP